MPDPWHYFQATAWVLLASAAVSQLGRRWNDRSTLAAGTPILAATVGTAAGLAWLHWLPALAPLNALDRLLVWIVPLVSLLEMIASCERWTKGMWVLRWFLACLVARLILAGSVYLAKSDASWSGPLRGLVILGSGSLLVMVWGLLSASIRRRQDSGYMLSLVLSLMVVSFTMAATGYLRGGVTGWIMAIAIGAALRPKSPIKYETALLGFGLVTLAGFLLIGRFFGRLTNLTTLLPLVAPCAYGITALPLLAACRPWQRAAIGLSAVLLTLTPVILVAVQAGIRLRSLTGM